MAQDNQSTQPQNEAINDTSSQPSVQVRDLDQGGEDGVTKTPEEMVTPNIEDITPDVEDSPSDDFRKLLEEQKKTIDDLKKGLYDKGREMKQMKDALTSVAPESEQQMAQGSEDDDELEAAASILRQKGFLTEDALDSFAKKIEEKAEIKEIISANPSLDPEVLEALRLKNPDLHVYDVIEKYKSTLLGDRALQKAHNRSVMGQPIAKEPQGEKTIAQMSDDEFNLYIKKQSTGRGNYL
jgi:hypothetical protein